MCPKDHQQKAGTQLARKEKEKENERSSRRASVRFHTLYFISPLSVPLAHVLQLLRAPARMGGFALYTQGTCPGTPGGTRVALNE